MAAEGDVIIQFIFTGEEDEVVPLNATHVTVDKSVAVVPERAFRWHQNIEEVDCHDGVEKVERDALLDCPSLRLVKIPGVKTVEGWAFELCKALTDVKFCDKLERIGENAFAYCKSLRSINLPSVKIVERWAFNECEALTNVTFGDKLESIGGEAFLNCRSLERITIPLKDGIIDNDDDDHDTFAGCMNLRHVDLVGRVHEFVAALHLDDWKNDMNAEINSINQILPNTPAGYGHYGEGGGKGRAVREWIKSVLRKLVDYKQQHRNLLMAAITILIEELALPQELVIYEIIPFLELPSCNWKDDKWHGWGEMMYADGRVYVGNWKDDKKHGWGEMTYADGTVYVGNWKDDKRHGGGIMTYADGRVYVGDWEDGNIHGWGEMTYADGRVYQGHWEDDKMHGYGRMTYADGTVYMGNWKDGFELEEDDDDEEEE